MNRFQTVESGQGLLKRDYPAETALKKALQKRKEKLLAQQALSEDVPDVEVQKRAQEDAILRS